MAEPHGDLGWLRRNGLEMTRAGMLLRHAERFPRPPVGRQVFVNRTLRLETIRYVGFDLDWTLADYDRRRLDHLTFELAKRRLIDGHGYPEAIRDLEGRPDFPRRGLLIDKRQGIVLRMNRHRYVGQAYLGRRPLGPTESSPLYRKEPINPSSSRFYHVDSLFELPETNLYAELIERRNNDPASGLPPPPQLFDDVRAAIDWVHREGVMKDRILAEPQKFLRRDPELGLALERFRLAGRRLVLITNSPWSYTEGVCAYLFDRLLPGLESWRALFDLVVVDSRKPAFFRNGGPFVALDRDGAAAGESRRPEWGGVYRGGSLSGLMELLDCPGEQVLYIGDHIYGDVVTSKMESTWRTALVVRELERELEQRGSLGHDLERLETLRDRLALLGHQMDLLGDAVSLIRRIAEDGGEVPGGTEERLRRQFSELKREHHRLLEQTRELTAQTSAQFNPYWGSFFKQGSSKTLFAAQLERYACLYTSRVSNFSFYGSNHYFRVLRDPMKHEERREER